jgi:hypothetical protein
MNPLDLKLQRLPRRGSSPWVPCRRDVRPVTLHCVERGTPAPVAADVFVHRLANLPVLDDRGGSWQCDHRKRGLAIDAGEVR